MKKPPKSLRHLSRKQVLSRTMAILRRIKRPKELTILIDDGPGCILQRLTKTDLAEPEEFYEFGVNDLSERALTVIIAANDAYQRGSIKKLDMVQRIRAAILTNPTVADE